MGCRCGRAARHAAGVVGAALVLAAVSDGGAAGVRVAYVGSVTCKPCHAKIYARWSTSLHAWAMKPAGIPPRRARITPNNCAPCHSRRAAMALDYVPGAEFLDSFDPELLDTASYEVDGQIGKEEGYEWGPFLQSKMYMRGVRCDGCHEPHSAQLRAQGNALCLRCHAIEYEQPSHTHHGRGTRASHCVECHMPERVYMERDPRRDHSFPTPDPMLAGELAVPDACSRCHAERGKPWIEQGFERWYPDAKLAARRAAARAVKLGRERRRAAIPALLDLLAAPADVVKRASAARLLGAFVSDDRVRRRLLAAVSDSNPLVRAAAVGALGRLRPPAGVVIRALRQAARDPVRLVRARAGFALRGTVVEKGPASAPVERALREWEMTAGAMAERAESQYNLGIFYAGCGKVARAVEAYRGAARFDPQAVAPRHNLAMLLGREGRRREAEGEFRAILRDHPEAAASAFALGLLYAEMSRPQDAARALEQCVRHAPNYPRAYYNLGLALAKAGDLPAGLAALEVAAGIPGSRHSAAVALGSLYAQLGDAEEAARWAAAAKKAAAE